MFARSAFFLFVALVVGRAFAQSPAVEVYFSPKQVDKKDCETVITDAIKCAKESIQVQAYSFTSDPIADALIEVSKRTPKVIVEVILDKAESEKKRSKRDKILNAHVPTFVDAHYKAHNKIIVIDGKVVITGSYNFSKDAKKNLENLLVIRDHDIAKTYSEHWRKRKESPEVTPATSPEPFPSASRDSGTTLPKGD